MDKFMKKIKIIGLLALSFLIAAGSVTPVSAAREDSRIIVITSVKDLKELSSNCALDSYSKGLTVKLENSIDLNDIKFSPIPIFYGTFDGQNYSITGLEIVSKGSNKGLFRSLEAGALVKNLNVSGSVSPKGIASSIGMIAGKNSGTISSCSVSGTISGDTYVGGIAGHNSSSGVISDCISNLDVLGNLYTGGISGYNDGVIENCTNNGKINTSNALSQADTGSSAPVFANTGGVAGQSTGIIRNCTNKSEIGSKNYGYNIGGIAGTQKGIISGCENSADISGRKDVGGIVGQFEPNIALICDEVKKEALVKELTALNTALDELAGSVKKSFDVSLESGDEISSAVSLIENAIKQEDDASSPEVKNTFQNLYKSLRKINAATEKINDYVSDFTEASNTELGITNRELNNIGAASENVKDNIDTVTSQLDIINQSLNDITEASGNLESLSSGIGGIMQQNDLTELRKFDEIRKLLKEYNVDGADSNTISASFKKIADALNTVNTQVKAIDKSLGISANETGTSQSIQLITGSSKHLQTALTEFSTGTAVQLDIISTETDKIDSLLYGFLRSAGDRFGKTFGVVYAQLNIISICLDDIAENSKYSKNDLSTALNSAHEQIGAIGKAVSAMLDTPDYSSVIVSSDIESEEKPGQVSSCRNNGAISANKNAGGIAGIMAMETGSDPEEDYAMPDSSWIDTRMLFRSLVMLSSNSGEIVAKNECAGGIVGKSSIGAVYKSENTAGVSAENGAKCGGIAGSSEGSIILCNVLSDLKGNDEVGGIAGSGANIANCRAMVRLYSSGEYLGAIAGKASGEIVSNIFVEEGLAGIDGVSYEERAYPLPYSEFVELEDTPDFFSELHFDFLADGKLVSRVPVEYGKSLKTKDIPSVPSRNGFFGAWEDFETEDILRSKTVNAVYKPWIKVLSSGGDSPIIRAEGEFSDKAYITLSEAEPSGSAGPAYESVRAYAYSIEDEIEHKNQKYKLQLRCDDIRDAKIAYADKGKVQVLRSVRDGSYLIFSAPPSGELIVLKPVAKRIVTIVFTALISIVVVAFIWYWEKRLPRESQDETKKSIFTSHSDSKHK